MVNYSLLPINNYLSYAKQLSCFASSQKCIHLMKCRGTLNFHWAIDQLELETPTCISHYFYKR